MRTWAYSGMIDIGDNMTSFLIGFVVSVALSLGIQKAFDLSTMKAAGLAFGLSMVICAILGAW